MQESKYFLTKNGFERIKREYENLFKVIKAKNSEQIPSLFESEDINPEYLLYQEDIYLFQMKIAEYEDILKNAKIITPPPKKDRDRVHLGAQVTVRANNQKDVFTIVGPLESDPSIGWISNESLVGKSLMGKKVNDIVSVQSYIKTTYKILKISYEHL